MCTRDSCGFCRFLAHLISLGTFRFVLAALLAFNLSLGLFWLFFSMDMRDETPFRFASELWPVAVFCLGLAQVFITMFGCFTTAFRGNPVHTQNVYRFMSMIAGVAALALGVTIYVVASDRAAIGGLMDYGWNNLAHSQYEKDRIRAAQAQYECCGFSGSDDRSVPPCPSNGRGGCDKPLIDEYVRILNTMASWVITGVPLAAFTVIWLYCYEEGFYHEMMKHGKDIYETNDPPRFGEDLAEPEVPLGARRVLNDFAELYKPARDEDWDAGDNEHMNRVDAEDDLDAGVFVQLHRDLPEGKLAGAV